jgi:hypothetical protein
VIDIEKFRLTDTDLAKLPRRALTKLWDPYLDLTTWLQILLEEDELRTLKPHELFSLVQLYRELSQTSEWIGHRLRQAAGKIAPSQGSRSGGEILSLIRQWREEDRQFTIEILRHGLKIADRPEE